LREGGSAAHGALERLHSAHHAWAAEVAIRALPSRRDLALDAAQEAWMRVALRPAHCRSAAELQAWLRRVIVNAAMDVLRRDIRQRSRVRRLAQDRAVLADSSQHHQGHAADAEQLAHLRQQLERLAADERALLDLRFRAGMTLAQMAGAVGIGPAAADSRLRRTLERLRAQQETP
jgi:RNA polymerase sigma-70 factor (ECF subfamily)